MRTSYFLIFSIIILLTSCKMNDMTIKVQSPAPVTIAPTVTRVGIINRALPSEEDKGRNSVHTVLSGETFTMLEEGSAESIRGLKDALMENQRFDTVLLLTKEKMYNPATGSFQSPVSWDKVESICNANQLDALFVLETFDTDLKVIPPPPMQVNNPTQILNAVQQTTISTTVRSGFRIYEKTSRIIADEYMAVQTMSFNATLNPLGTIDGLLQRKEYVKQAANRDGRAYAERILTYWHWVPREYFVKGTDNFKVAMRRARAGNWDGAAELWLKETSNSRSKIAGRACYNMAISSEINGKLDDAIRWAEKSYTDYNTKQALRYLNILKNRKSQEGLVEYQNGK